MLGIKNLIKSESGTILLLSCLVMILFLGIMAIVIDFGKQLVVREQLQTAVDAGSLAGALHGERHVKINVRNGRKYITCGEEGCRCVTSWNSPVVLEGKEKDLYENPNGPNGWQTKLGCSSGCPGTPCRFINLQDRWIEFPEDTESIAKDFVQRNWPSFMSPSQGGSTDEINIEIHEDRNDNKYPSVIARAIGTMKTELMKINGIRELSSHRCGQSGVFYTILNGGISKQPANGCD